MKNAALVRMQVGRLACAVRHMTCEIVPVGEVWCLGVVRVLQRHVLWALLCELPENVWDAAIALLPCRWRRRCNGRLGGGGAAAGSLLHGG